jgi:hypothetical protein
MYSSVVPLLAAKVREILVRKKDPESMSTLLDDLESTLDDYEHIFELLEFRSDLKERLKNPVSPAVKAHLTKEYRSHHHDTQKVVGKQADVRGDYYITEMPTRKHPSGRTGKKSRGQEDEAMYTSDEYSLDGEDDDGDLTGFVVGDNEVEFQKKAKKKANAPKGGRKKKDDGEDPDLDDHPKTKPKSGRQKDAPSQARKKKDNAKPPPPPRKTASISSDSSDDDVRPINTKKAATPQARRRVVRADYVELELSSDDAPPAKPNGSRQLGRIHHRE